MPVVPIRPAAPSAPTRVPMPDDVYLMMAAAQMHSEGRLIKADSTPPTQPPKEYFPTDGSPGPAMMT